jgi:putative ABC transport system substrate-binding protein
MRRRELILLIGGAISAVRSARAQQPARKPVIGFLGIGSASGFSYGLAAFREGLQGQGYIEGKNVAIEYRWAAGDAVKLPALAAELVGMQVDVIAAVGGNLPALAAQAVLGRSRSFRRALRKSSRTLPGRAPMSPASETRPPS